VSRKISFAPPLQPHYAGGEKRIQPSEKTGFKIVSRQKQYSKEIRGSPTSNFSPTRLSFKTIFQRFTDRLCLKTPQFTSPWPTMEQVMQSVSDVERKLTKINHTMSKGISQMSMNDMVKQARKGNSVKYTIKKGVKSSTVNRLFFS